MKLSGVRSVIVLDAILNSAHRQSHILHIDRSFSHILPRYKQHRVNRNFKFVVYLISRFNLREPTQRHPSIRGRELLRRNNRRKCLTNTSRGQRGRFRWNYYPSHSGLGDFPYLGLGETRVGSDGPPHTLPQMDSFVCLCSFLFIFVIYFRSFASPSDIAPFNPTLQNAAQAPLRRPSECVRAN